MTVSKPPSSDHVDPNQPLGLASVGLRLIAIVYDGMLILASLFLVSTILIVVGTPMSGSSAADATELPTWYRHFVMFPAMVMTLVGFYGIFWRWGGQTLGMQTWRLKTVTTDGTLLTWGQTIKRILAACIVPSTCALLAYVIYDSRGAASGAAILGLMLNYAYAWVNQKGLAIHDIISSTVTVRMPKTPTHSLFSRFRNKGE